MDVPSGQRMNEIAWHDAAGDHRALWPSESVPLPGRVVPAGDRTTADVALRRARAGESLLYAGDYHNARQLLAAMARRLIRTPRPARIGRSHARGAGRRRDTRGWPPVEPTGDLAAAWLAERSRRLLEHEVLSRLLVPLGSDLSIELRRAPDMREACREAWGEMPPRPVVAPLREVLGAVGAHEWRRKGVEVAALGGRIHPHHGVFAPVRGEHVDLVAGALGDRRLDGKTAFDVGTGTGVLAILLARRGARVVATDLEPRAVACARDNASSFDVADRVEVVLADLFPAGRADLVVCNPPWIPGSAHTRLERAVFDPEGDVLSRFLAGLGDHLAPSGEGWLVLSDLAVLLGLRAAGWLGEAIARAGLAVSHTRSTRPSHPRARDRDDPLHAARSAETTTLYVLGRLASG
jgi:methylase of polypeptide subunit release factors